MNEQIREFAEEAGLIEPNSIGKEHEAAEKFAELLLAHERKMNGTFTSITLRDHFAGLAMQLLNIPYAAKQEAKAAYELADAMLEERKK